MSFYIHGKPIREYTPMEFMEYIRSLRILPTVAAESKAAAGIKLFINKAERITIRCKRETKQVTEEEIALLALEYKVEIEKLRDTFDKRKFTITNQQGEQTNVKSKRTRARRPTKTADQRNAHLDQNTEWASRSDQLFQSGTSANVPEESSLRSELEPETADR